MGKLSRLMRHLTTTSAAGRRAFPPPALKAVQAAIAKGEKLHRAEVRLAVEAALPFWDAFDGMSSRERARELFSQHRIWDTEENCGILVYVNLADHKVEIIADRGVGRVLDASDWQSVCRTMTQGFAQGAYEQSAVAALEELNALLAAHFPADGSTVNELSNRPLVL